jgi:hypothetical protein
VEIHVGVEGTGVDELAAVEQSTVVPHIAGQSTVAVHYTGVAAVVRDAALEQEIAGDGQTVEDIVELDVVAAKTAHAFEAFD